MTTTIDKKSFTTRRLTTFVCWFSEPRKLMFGNRARSAFHLDSCTPWRLAGLGQWKKWIPDLFTIICFLDLCIRKAEYMPDYDQQTRLLSAFANSANSRHAYWMVYKSQVFLHLKGAKNASSESTSPKDAYDTPASATSPRFWLNKSLYFKKVFFEDQKSSDVSQALLLDLVPTFVDGFNTSLVHIGNGKSQKLPAFQGL